MKVLDFVSSQLSEFKLKFIFYHRSDSEELSSCPMWRRVV